MRGCDALRNAGRSSSERLSDEHSGLRDELVSTGRAIRQLAQSGETGRAGRRSTRRLLRQIAALERRLRGHFAAEEASGHLADALQAAPRYHARAEALLAQHPDLAAEMHRVRVQACGAATLPDWKEVQRSFVQLAELIAAHEQAETEIVSGSLQDDLGTGD
jgi:hypothetical protein